MTEIIGREEMRIKIARGDPFVLVEVLSPSSYASGHLPGAINLPLDKLAVLAPTLLPDKNAEIIVYCKGPT